MSDALQVTPTRSEARRLVVSLAAFWTCAGIIALVAPADESSKSLPAGFTGLFLVGMGAGAYFYWILYRIGARETGRRAASFFLPGFTRKGDFWASGRDGWRILLKLLKLSWWRRVIGITEWPAPLGVGVLVLSLGVALVAGVRAMVAAT